VTKRMIVAALAAAGIFVALYLTLYKFGVFGDLACGIGSCEVVNASRWAILLGLPVAAWGLAFYVVTFTIAMVGLRAGLADSRAVAGALLALSTTGFLFSAWLTCLELFVIRAICQWCVVSAIIATGMFAAALLDYRELSRPVDHA
jgi:uncharacterized membrane protein